MIWYSIYVYFLPDEFNVSQHQGAMLSVNQGAMLWICWFHSVSHPFWDGSSYLLLTYSRWTNYSNPASMSCRLPPVPPNFNVMRFRIFVPDLRVWFISSIRRSEPNQKNNIVIGGAGGYWITRVWMIRPSTVRGAVVSRSAENVKGNFS